MKWSRKEKHLCFVVFHDILHMMLNMSMQAHLLIPTGEKQPLLEASVTNLKITRIITCVLGNRGIAKMILLILSGVTKAFQCYTMQSLAKGMCILTTPHISQMFRKLWIKEIWMSETMSWNGNHNQFLWINKLHTILKCSPNPFCYKVLPL